MTVYTLQLKLKKKLILLFREDALNSSKVTLKTFIMLQRFIFQINAVLLKFIKTIKTILKIWSNNAANSALSQK